MGVVTPARKNRFRMPVRTGCRYSGSSRAWRRARCRPRSAIPCTGRRPALSFSTMATRVAEIVGAVGVAHHQKASIGQTHAVDDRRAISARLAMNDRRAKRTGEQLAAVGAAVVGNDDFARQSEPVAHLLQGLPGVDDAMRQAARLVEAGHDDRHIDFRLPGLVRSRESCHEVRSPRAPSFSGAAADDSERHLRFAYRTTRRPLGGGAAASQERARRP